MAPDNVRVFIAEALRAERLRTEEAVALLAAVLRGEDVLTDKKWLRKAKKLLAAEGYEPMTTFPEIDMFRQRRGKCVGCGRLTNHRVKAWQTVSPFNKSASGMPKTVDEIREELRDELERKASVPLKCANCDPNRGNP